MNRREFIKLSSLTLTGLGLNNAFAGRHKPPNILIIYSDQHKDDLLGCVGNQCIKTPNLDASAGLLTKAL